MKTFTRGLVTTIFYFNLFVHIPFVILTEPHNIILFVMLTYALLVLYMRMAGEHTGYYQLIGAIGKKIANY